MKDFDLVIIGAGPAGLTAGIYAARYKLSTVILGKKVGGTCLDAHSIENYPGFQKISGYDLMEKFIAHVKSYNIEIEGKEVKRVIKEDKKFKVVTEDGEYLTKTVILALGGERRKLNIPGEEKFLGKGVSYCAVCDAMFFRNKVVAVVGGSDAAVASAVLLAEHAEKVYIIYRRDKFRAEPKWIERLENNSKIESIFQTNVLKINGKEKVESVELDREYQGSKQLKIDGIFIEIGSTPVVGLAQDLGVKLSENGFILIDINCQTNVPGVFAAGDVTSGKDDLKQVITAAAQGAEAATSAFKYINSTFSQK